MDTNPIIVVSSVPVPMGPSGTNAMLVSQVLDPQATPWLGTPTSASRHDVSGAHGPAITESGDLFIGRRCWQRASNHR